MWIITVTVEGTNNIKLSFRPVFHVTVVSGSGVPRNFVGGGSSTNSVEDRENGDLGAVAP